MHGGNLSGLSNKYNLNKEDIIDFSGNISPITIPSRIKDIVINNFDVISTYPDIKYTKLRNSIGEYCDCDASNIMVGNGSTELISLFIKQFAKKRVIVVAPVYSEFERELKKNDCEIIKFALEREEFFNLNVDRLINLIDDSIDLVILCNPNNPTGNAIDILQIERILKKAKFLMIDENYVEFTRNFENISATALTKNYSNLFVIRGTSKFFSIAGLRLGYAVCGNESIVNDINNSKELWSVNCFADLIGQALFEDKKFIEDAKKIICSERERVILELLKFPNLKVYSSKSNFILCEILNNKVTSEQLFEMLLSNNIAVRDAKDFEFLDNAFFRFCILSKENNNLLIDNIKKYII